MSNASTHSGSPRSSRTQESLPMKRMIRKSLLPILSLLDNNKQHPSNTFLYHASVTPPPISIATLMQLSDICFRRTCQESCRMLRQSSSCWSCCLWLRMASMHLRLVGSASGIASLLCLVSAHLVASFSQRGSRLC